ncbi:hypothetical protein [Streptomyces sp. NPDC058045]|uniref:hypothetical protein n=1 Tax=Streptomyces sp. NPDC058045 TaxID=3346311 RepID=UPI0036E06752
MELPPQPPPGEPRPWAFPAPEYGTLGNGLAVRYGHRLVTVLVGDAARFRRPVGALGIGNVTVVGR